MQPLYKKYRVCMMKYIYGEQQFLPLLYVKQLKHLVKQITCGEQCHFILMIINHFIIKYSIMKNFIFKISLLKSCLFILFCMTVFISTARAGLDYYEIFIGEKLVLKRAVNQPLNLESLPITQANSNEQLLVYYYQCNAPDKLARKRIITLKDADGNKIKEWKFADASGSNIAMIIPVKELLQLQKANKNSLTLFYSAEGKIKEEKLVSVSLGNKTVGLLEARPQNVNESRVAALCLFEKVYRKTV